MSSLAKQQNRISQNSIWQYRHLIIQLIARELKARYYTSFLGFLWIVFIPLSTLAIYTFIFSVVLPSVWPSNKTTPYAFILFAALIPFTLFTDVIGRSPALVLSHPNYVKKVVFPLHILSIVTLGGALIDSLISMLLLLFGLLIFLHTLPITAFLLPLAYLPLLLITLGLSWFLAALGVYVRDTGPAINIVTRLLFFLTPIVYPLERIPEKYLWIMKLNPLSMITETFRNVLIWGKPPDWTTWLLWTLASGSVALLGYLWFVKTRTGFADVL